MKKFFLAFLALLIAHTTRAADSLTHYKYPQVLLVELKSERNRINAFTGSGRYKELEEVEKDAKGENNAMTNDFKENFTYCPVYYFFDNDIDMVLKKQFDGILLDTSLIPVKSTIMNTIMSNYIIVFYGYPFVHSDSQNDSGDPNGRGLIINNDRMQQMTYLYNLSHATMIGSTKKMKNYYSSKHFDLEYYPHAKEFNRRLKTGTMRYWAKED